MLLTHDASTVPDHAYKRIAAGLPMAGVFVVPQRLPVGQFIEQILLAADCSLEGEWEGRVTSRFAAEMG